MLSIAEYYVFVNYHWADFQSDLPCSLKHMRSARVKIPHVRTEL